jgi:hypothetical protein
MHKPTSSAAKKAAAKRAAAKAAAKKAAAKRAAAAKRVAAAKKVAETRKQVARKSLMSNILNSVTPDVPSDLPSDMPTPDPSQTDPTGSGSSGDFASMPIRCMAVYRDGNSPCNWYGPIDTKPTAQQLAFNAALKVAYSDLYSANQAAYDTFEAATVDARTALEQAMTADASESQWMQVYLDYMVATRDAQAELNASTLSANSAFVEAKYAAIQDFDAATYDATTEEGASALAALADYREASKALELQQFANNLSDSTQLTDGIITRMQTFIDLLATLTSDADITAARDAYYADLGSFYYDTAVASNDSLKDLYDAVKTTEDAFVTLTGSAPLHPEYYPWWWYGQDDEHIVIDPLPPVPGDGPDPVVDPVPGDTGPSVDPTPGEGPDPAVDPISGPVDPPIAVCPTCPPAPDFPRPVLDPSED